MGHFLNWHSFLPNCRIFMYNTLDLQKEFMSGFSQKRFVDLGQALYIEWMSKATGLGTLTDQERLEVFKLGAEYSFEAAEQFAKVFRNQEDSLDV